MKLELWIPLPWEIQPSIFSHICDVKGRKVVERA